MKRFSVEVETDPEYVEVGLVFRVWDSTRKKVYGWYPQAADAVNAAAWLNATDGKVD